MTLAAGVAACADPSGSVAPTDAPRRSAAADRTPHVVVLSATAQEVVARRTVQLVATLTNPGGQPVQGRLAAQWTSSDPKIATVDANGLVTGVRAGAATITVAFPGWGVIGTAKVTVLPETLRRSAQERGLYIGAAVGYTASTFPTNAPYVAILGREFNMLVPENILKWQTLRRDGPTSWRFQFMDEMVAFAEAHRMQVRGHALGWHSGNAAWVNALTPTTTTRAQAIAILEEHVTTVVARYRGRVREYDVANEVIRDGASGPVGSPGDRRPAAESVWERVIGPDWVDVAFRAARAADPKAKLFYNDYSIEVPNTNKQNRVFHLVADLQAKGVPIDGVGFQSHYSLGGVPTDAQLKQSLDRFAALGLQVQMTELDIGLSAAQQNPAGYAQQAAEYRRVVQACVDHPACDAVVVWGIDDGNSWRAANRPTLFDAAFAPKPAYYSVLDYLAGH
jgi:endo-1,4-beta-xylanase